jgi:Domain of unknown function (DUF3427)
VLVLRERRTELLFVTLDKRQGFHAGIAFHDYAISPELFHWQTQGSVATGSAAAQRYLEGQLNGWQFQLFVRADRDAPYRACGPLTLESAEGSRPMSIVWRLQRPLPPQLFRQFSVLR